MSKVRTMSEKSWQRKNSKWIIWSFFGLSWVGFFWIAKKARQRRWFVMGIIFFILQFVPFILLGESTPVDTVTSNQEQFGPIVVETVEPNEQVESDPFADIMSAIFVSGYIAGIVFTFKERKKYFICLDVLEDANLEEKKENEYRRNVLEGYKKKGLFDDEKSEDEKTIVVEDNSFNFSDINPIDINKCIELDLINLPGVTIDNARKAIKYREDNNGYKSIDEFVRIIELKPHHFALVKDKLICGIVEKNQNSTFENDDSKKNRKLDF